MYKCDNCSLFVGFTTAPIGECENLKKEIRAIFTEYSEKLKKETNVDDNHNSNPLGELYQPKFYALFGEFDLAIISLIDNFDLGNRKFHPYSLQEQIDEYSSQRAINFNYKIITGPAPTTLKGERSLIEKASETFLCKESSKALISITSLKLNNSLLIGSGVRFTTIVEKALIHIINERKGVDFLLVETFSWHELTLILFSDSYDFITEIIAEIREFSLLDIYKITKDDDCYNYILQHSLVACSTFHPENQIKDAHVFTSTFSNFGYDIDLDLEKKDIGPNNNFYVSTIWHVKPGHLRQSINAIAEVTSHSKAELEESVRLVVGQGDYIYPELTKKGGLKEQIELINFLGKSTAVEKIKKHIKRTVSIPQIKCFPKNFLQAEPDDHPYFHDQLSNYAFSLKSINSIRIHLKRSLVSKIMQEKVINMYVNFNDGIQDTNLYIYFIELRPFLKNVKQRIVTFIDEDITVYDITTILDGFVKAFDIAYGNRFHQSYRMGAVTDFNMEFNGGIHQLISSLDMAYKFICKQLGDQDLMSFISIGGLTDIESSYHNMRLNYFHVFQPSIFLVPVVKEASNFKDKRQIEFYNDDFQDKLGELVDFEFGFIKYLKQKKSTKSTLEYTHFVKKYIKGYFKSDMISFVYLFNLDLEEMYFWYWGYWLQTPENYNNNGDVVESNFLNFLVRIVVLYDSIDPDFLNQKLKAPVFFLEELWGIHFSAVRDLYTEISQKEIEGLTLKKWQQHNFIEALAIVAKDLPEDETVLVKMKNSLDYKFEEKGREYKMLIQNIMEDKPNEVIDLLLERFLMVDALSISVQEYFEQNKLFEFNPVGASSYPLHLHLQALCRAYLKLLHSNIKGDNKYIAFQRDYKEQGKPLINNNNKHKFSGLLFDPTGGIYVPQLEQRRLYLKNRSLFMKSLWDFAAKTKKQFFNLND